MSRTPVTREPRPTCAPSQRSLSRRVGHRLNAAVSLASLDRQGTPRWSRCPPPGTRHQRDRCCSAFLNVAYHATSDVPEQTTQVKVSYPGIKLRVARPVGADATLLKGLDAVLKASGFRPAPDTGVVLASAGSAFESARARHAALALGGDPTDGEAPQSRSLRVQVPAFQMPLRRFANRVSNELWSHRSSSHLACYPIESPARHVQLARSP